MNECPHCGCKVFYRKVKFSGNGVMNYRFDGMTADNTHLHEDTIYKESDAMFCEDCHRRIGSFSKKGQS